MKDKISLVGMVFDGRHGVSPEEKEIRQRFIVDVDLYGDWSQAAEKDDLTNSVDYSHVFLETKKIVEGKSFNLLEALASQICETILRKFRRVSAVTVRVKKPNVPLKGPLEAAAVEMTRAR